MVTQAEQEALTWAIRLHFEISPAAFFFFPECFAVLFFVFVFNKISRLRSNVEFFPSLLGINISTVKAIILMTVLEMHFPKL